MVVTTVLGLAVKKYTTRRRFGFDGPDRSPEPVDSRGDKSYQGFKEIKRWKGDNDSNSRMGRNEEEEDDGNENKRCRLMFRGWPVKMEEIQKMSSKCLNYVHNDLVVPFNKNILVIENYCDQTIINIRDFLIESFASVQFNVGGDLNIMKSTKLEIYKFNHTFLDQDPDQTEALLQPH